MSRRPRRGAGTWRRLAPHLLPALRAQRATIALATASLLAEVALRLAEPWPLKLVFDRVLPQAGRTAGAAGLEASQVISLAAIALVAAVSLRAVASYIQTVALATVASRALTGVREALFRQMQLLPLGFHARARAGDLTVRLTNDVGMLQDVAVTALLPLLGDATILVGMTALMLWMQPGLALIACAPLPFFLFRWRRTHGRLREAARAQRAREGAMAAAAAESVSAIRTVQALSMQDAMAGTFGRQNAGSLKQGVRSKRLAAGLERSVDILIALSTALVLWRGAYEVLGGAMSAGDLVVFVAYLKAAFKPLQSFAKYTARLGKASAAAERVLEILETPVGTPDAPGAIVAPPLRGAVRFEVVSFGYEPDVPILREVSFSIAPGELVAVVGRSGAGKSTLASLLTRLHEPVSGRIVVDGEDIRAYRRESYRAQVGVVLQDTVLFAGTLRHNLQLVAPDADDTRLLAALRDSHALEFIAPLPDGLDTMVGERGVTLSNGQRQRLALARAFLRNTPLVVLDEPTAGLDEDNEQAVAAAIARLARGRTTILVTHALHLAARADRVLVLDGGQVVEQGAPSVLVRDGGQFARWYREQAARSGIAPAPVPYAVSHVG